MVHKDKNHFKCDACDKSFSENSVLSAHLKKDHGDKPYQCKVCGKTFKSSLGSEIHMKKHNVRGRKTSEKYEDQKISYEKEQTASTLGQVSFTIYVSRNWLNVNITK